MNAAKRTLTSRRTLLASAASAALIAQTRTVSGQQPPPSPLKLWYTRPADAWTEALPIGNGRLGAMVFGGVARERLQLNEDTLWAGSPYDPNSPDARTALPEVRRLLFAGQYVEANALAARDMMARSIRQPSYQTIGDLMMRLAASSYSEDYRRTLDLDTANALQPKPRALHARDLRVADRSGDRRSTRR